MYYFCYFQNVNVLSLNTFPVDKSVFWKVIPSMYYRKSVNVLSEKRQCTIARTSMYYRQHPLIPLIPTKNGLVHIYLHV